LIFFVLFFVLISNSINCSCQANEILSSFDVSLRQYATNHLSKVIELQFTETLNNVLAIADYNLFCAASVTVWS
jgi:hypothetical protein